MGKNRVELLKNIGVILEDLYEEVSPGEYFSKLDVSELEKINQNLLNIISILEKKADYDFIGLEYDNRTREPQILDFNI